MKTFIQTLTLLFLFSQSFAADSSKPIVASDDLPGLKQAYESYQTEIATQPQNYDVKIEAADVIYYLAAQTTDKTQKKKYLEEGIALSKQAITLSPSKPGGHFYYGLLTGLKAESSGILTGLSSKDIIKEEMEKVLQIDPRYSEGDAYLALGQWYRDVPSLMGGDKAKALEYLKKAVEIAPHKSQAHRALAELYLKEHQKDLARQEIQSILSTPLTPKNRYETRKDQQAARAMLEKLNK